MDFSEVLLGLRQAIACNKISQQDLNRIIHRGGFPYVLKMTLPPSQRQLQSSPEPELIVIPEHSRYPSRYVNSESASDPCDHRAERRVTADGRVLCACCGLNICEITESPGGQPLPPFDPTIERTAHGDALSDAIASGEVEVSREDVSIEEVIAKIEVLEQELETDE